MPLALAKTKLFGLVAGMSRENARSRIEVGGRIIDGNRRLAKAARNEFHFAGIGRYVARRVNAAEIGFHPRRDGDIVSLKGESPLRERPNTGVKTETGEHFIGSKRLRRLRFIVHKDDRVHVTRSANLFDLIEKF